MNHVQSGNQNAGSQERGEYEVVFGCYLSKVTFCHTILPSVLIAAFHRYSPLNATLGAIGRSVDKCSRWESSEQGRNKPF